MAGGLILLIFAPLLLADGVPALLSLLFDVDRLGILLGADI